MRVVIAEDQALMRDGLTLLLERNGFEVVAAATDGEDLVRRVRAHRPQLVLTDIRMPPTHTDEGLTAALTIRRESPGAAIAVLSSTFNAISPASCWRAPITGAGSATCSSSGWPAAPRSARI